MAYVFHDRPLPNLYTVAYEGLSKWNQWATIDKSVVYAISGTNYIWDIYYSAEGTNGFVGIAVPAYEIPSGSEVKADACYIVRKDTGGNVIFLDALLINGTQIVTIIVTNTVAYIGVRDTESADPHGIFATVVVSQENPEMTEVAVGFYDDTLHKTKFYDGNQSTIAEEPLSALWYNFPYTILVPLAGLNYGVASGIYRFIYNEFQASNTTFQSMVLNNKTFYVDDNIAIIDYFTGF